MFVLHQQAADHRGYTRLVCREPIGTTQAGAWVLCRWGDGFRHEILLHGQKEFDVVSGSVVEFPDDTTFHADFFDEPVTKT